MSHIPETYWCAKCKGEIRVLADGFGTRHCAKCLSTIKPLRPLRKLWKLETAAEKNKPVPPSRRTRQLARKVVM